MFTDYKRRMAIVRRATEDWANTAFVLYYNDLLNANKSGLGSVYVKQSIT